MSVPGLPTLPARLSAVHVNLFLAHLSSWKRPQERRPRSVNIVKNLANCPPIFPLGYSHFVCTTELAKELAAVAHVESVPCKLIRAFYYTVIPGDMSYEEDAAYDSRFQSAERVVQRFATHYKVRVPPMSLVLLDIFELGADELAGSEEEFVLKCEGSTLARVNVSRRLVSELGWYWCGGALVCSDAAFSVIRKWVDTLFYCCQELT